MSSLEKKREEFRKYLESAGALDSLTKAMIKLYEKPNKPSDAIKFLRQNMCAECPTDEQYEMMTADLKHAKKKICDLERELSRMKGSIRRSASEVDLALKKGFDDLNAGAETQSLLKKVLTRDILETMKNIKTNCKGTLLDCIQSGLECLDSPIGAYACDAGAYKSFAPLFDPLIEMLHGFKGDDKQPELDWGESCKLTEWDAVGDKVVSVRIHCCRSVEGYPFAAIMSMEQYEQIMVKLQVVTKCLSGDMKGKFHALEGIESDLKKTLDGEGVMSKENNQYLKAANATRFWPTGRGVFVNEAKTFAIWCNEEDHLRFISMEQGGDLRSAYDRLINTVTRVSKDMALARDERLGFFTFSPENLGNTITVTVQLRLEKLSQETEMMCELPEKLGVKISKLTEDDDNKIYEVVSKKRLGITEFQTVKQFSDAIVAIIEAENSL